MTKKKNYPHWTFPSKRVFHRRKRADLLALKKAIQHAQCGIAYVPGYAKHWHEMVKHANELIESARPRNWK